MYVHFVGGKSDMAAWSSLIWHELVHLIEKGFASCQIPKNTLYLRCSRDKRRKKNEMGRTSKIKARKISLIHFRNVNDKDIKMTQTLRGVRFNIRGESALKLQAVKEKFKQSKNIKQRHWRKEPITFSTKNKYAKLGW